MSLSENYNRLQGKIWLNLMIIKWKKMARYHLTAPFDNLLDT